MTRRYIHRPALIALLLLSAVSPLTRASAQSRAYLKFGSGGEAIGLFNLIKNPSTCGDRWQVVSGAVTRTLSEKRNEDLDYRFTLIAAGKLRSFTFTLGVDELPRSEIEKLIARRRGVKVRACEAGRMWRAEEIVRDE
jgi:hypothetical protein